MPLVGRMQAHARETFFLGLWRPLEPCRLPGTYAVKSPLRVAYSLRCTFSYGNSRSFCASFTLSMSEPPPCMLSILTMSDKSAYCTAAREALFFSRISGVL